MTGRERDRLLERDAAHVWHPYTQHGLETDFLPVARAAGSILTLTDGRELIDGISSWWACLHGHSHPRMIEAMRDQLGQLDHVLFGGATHEPAVRLAEELVAIAPTGLSRVFYSDNGSTAIEVALKMVVQSWLHRGEANRRVFVALEGGYHGDTFGAMAVGDPDPFFLPFLPMLFEVRRVPADAAVLRATFDELGNRAAGFICEPLVQAAGGMVMQSPDFLREVRAACDGAGVPWIADEVMTGFGRTGAMFACDRARVSPDYLCLAKGLTGGNFPLSVTMAHESTFDAFKSVDRRRAFFHGHTFTANPVGCAAGIASLAICRAERTPERIEAIGVRIETRLAAHFGDAARSRNLRRIGGIIAFEMQSEESGYLASAAPRLRALAVEHGVLLRPLGNVIYAMPPSCTSESECDLIADAMIALDAAV